MKKTKTQKGITLVALIITIVVLMILAAVAISSITNDGIISKAESSKDKYEQEQIKEQDMLEYYEQLLAGTVKYVKDVQGQVLSTTENTNVYDSYGNKIVLLAGFKITTDADTVEEGIVIEDATVDSEGNATATSGSQFVWIPVGNVKSSKGTKTITLGRYVFADGTPSAYSGSCTEDTVNGHDSKYKNVIARDIEAFIASVNTKGGYYLGRYEARTNNTTERAAKTDELTPMTTVDTNAVYNYVTQAQALERSQAMYGETGTFSSDLINSFAWDTAIVFLQEFDDRTGEDLTPYSRQKSLNTSLSTTGTTTDVICNIYDMASNCYEWSTETYSDRPSLRLSWWLLLQQRRLH